MNILKLMKNAGKIQEMMQQQQQMLANSVVTGEAGAGLVRIEMNGKHHVSKLEIDDSLLSEKSVLIDLIIAATNNAVEKIGDVMQNQMMDASKMLGGDLGGLLGGEEEK